MYWEKVYLDAKSKVFYAIQMKNLPTILVVEGHKQIRVALCNLLAINFPGIHLDEVENGESALKQVILNSPDLVLMDVELPKMNGIETTRSIKQRLPETKVVVFRSMKRSLRNRSTGSRCKCILNLA
jgi:DNA-binding NarL/FixJ family response regulator